MSAPISTTVATEFTPSQAAVPPRTFNKSWGKTKKGKGIPPTNVNGPRNTHPSQGVPAGQYLSKTSSEVSNDPLAEKAYFPGPSEEFRAMANYQKIYPGFTALPVVSEESYNKVCAVSPSFKKNVPRGAYDYYLAVFAFYRMLSIRHANGEEMSLEEMNFMGFMDRSDLTIPKSVLLYLSGIGNTKAPKSRELRCAFIEYKLVRGCVSFKEHCEIEIPGFFGGIATNSGLYANYPCLAVYATRIYHDLLHTNFADVNRQWDLPPGLNYPTHAINRNCLGYQDSVRLSPEHRGFYDDLAISTHGFDFNNSGLPINFELMTAIHVKLSHSRMTLYPSPKTSQGSVGQLPISELVEPMTGRLLAGTFRAYTAFELPSLESWIGTSFMYLIRKDYTESLMERACLPITLGRNVAIPVAIRESVNQLYSLTVDWIKPHLYSVVEYQPNIRMEILVSKDSAVA